LNINAGRFYGRDSFEGIINRPHSRHPFLYANGNPVIWTDSGGNFTLVELTVTVAIIGVLSLIPQPLAFETPNIGTGVFVQTHQVQWPAPYQHASVKLVLPKRSALAQQRPQIFRNIDSFGNRYATIGAGPEGGIASIFARLV